MIRDGFVAAVMRWVDGVDGLDGQEIVCKCVVVARYGINRCGEMDMTC